ncbi:MAG: single-stranded-DNA-specific exonuclease RecJ [Clostridiales bacterium]|jgi:single-stranded-DNA-specific exonuclease|nr:single-stranded-DNA-specific exonuclease RecJ [Clostridiales bacterium]
MSTWILRQTDANLQLMTRVLGISPVAARILANRGIRSKLAAKRYLDPDIRLLAQASVMKGMELAARTLSEAIDEGKKIAIFGDYDVDGVMGTVILEKLLAFYGTKPIHVIPKRSEGGYGLSLAAVQKLKDAGVELLVTCDNGISAIDEIALAKKLGMEVVVVDHHEPKYTLEDGAKREILPNADCIVDPKQQTCGYPFKQYCAAGLAYRLAGAMEAIRGKPFGWSKMCLALAAIATICDIVPLQDENRMLAKQGLAALNKDKKINLGLWHLMAEKKIEEKVISVFDVGFIIGPCINAAGRLAHAAEAVDLFLSEDPVQSKDIAVRLAELNETRKTMTEQACERALSIIDESELDKVLVLFDSQTHESIAGVVAGRIKERLCRPVIMLTNDLEGRLVKGSARSIDCYNIFDALSRNDELFLRFGGHAMAAGLTLEERNVSVLRERLNAQCELSEDNFVPALYIDMQLQPEEATYALAKELEGLAPFGKDNPEPLFLAKGLSLEYLRMIDAKNTIIFTFSCATGRMKAVCFGQNDVFKANVFQMFDEAQAARIFAGSVKNAGFGMDVVYSPEINEYNNSVSVQMRVKDFRLFKRWHNG